MSGPRYRILIVDDDACSRKVLAKKLERSEHDLTIDAVESGREALPLWRRQRYDLAFIDIVMPKMDGIELARHFKTEGQPRRRCPLIAYTAKVLAHEREALMAMETSFHDVLGKPICNETLEEILRRWLINEPMMG